MNKTYLWALAIAGALFANHSHAAKTNFAARVIQYEPGLGFAAGFTNVETVLGDVSRENPFGEATDPFDPPYGKNQVLSLGEGGSVTIQFARPVHNHRRNPFGIDFIIFGNSGFIITNDFDPMTFEWIGAPATDGSLFGANPGTTRVSVSHDGRHFYELAEAPVADVLFPSDGAGDPTQPVPPSLTADAFAGATLDGMRALYHGAAGGAGYDLSTARTGRGKRKPLSSIRFVRVEVLAGKSELDAFCATGRSKD